MHGSGFRATVDHAGRADKDLRRSCKFASFAWVSATADCGTLDRTARGMRGIGSWSRPSGCLFEDSCRRGFDGRSNWALSKFDRTRSKERHEIHLFNQTSFASTAEVGILLWQTFSAPDQNK